MPQRNKIFGIKILVLLFSLPVKPQAQPEKIAIGFYNLENLFDIQDDSLTIDEEFTPSGLKRWTTELYQDKLQRLSKVIHLMDKEDKSGSLAVLGVCEIENRKVLEDLCTTELLRAKYYKIIHYNSPDARGVDVALLYQPKYFTVLYSQSRSLPLFDKDSMPRLTRDILLVKGKLGQQLVFILVNHWPSRRGGEESKQFRIVAAKLNRLIADSIQLANPDAALIIMGDFNDNPVDESLAKGIHALSDIKKVHKTSFYNPFYKNFRKGEGTTSYNDAWHLFDQILISGNMLMKNKPINLVYETNLIFKKSFMFEKFGHWKNNPKRTFSGDQYNYGYSDHFPVMCYFNLIP